VNLEVQRSVKHCLFRILLSYFSTSLSTKKGQFVSNGRYLALFNGTTDVWGDSCPKLPPRSPTEYTLFFITVATYILSVGANAKGSGGIRCCSDGSVHRCGDHHKTEAKEFFSIVTIIIFTLLLARPAALFQGLG